MAVGYAIIVHKRDRKSVNQEISINARNNKNAIKINGLCDPIDFLVGLKQATFNLCYRENQIVVL